MNPPPFAHQKKGFDLSMGKPAFALFMEQRTGKSRVVLDTARAHFEQGDIRTLIVAAYPNGLHRNWVSDEAPQWLPVGYKTILWGAGSTSKRWQAQAEEALKHPGFLLVAVNIEAIATVRCRAFLNSVLKRGPAFTAIDESTCIGEPGSQRTKLAIRLGRASKFRRILTGTPTTEGPFKLYSQFNFLDPTILNFGSYYAFKHFVADWKKGFNNNTQTEFEEQARDDDGNKVFKNLDQLQALIAPYSFRVLKKDCFDLPPKVYQKRYFQLTSEQQHLYNTLRDEYRAELKEGTTTAVHVLTRRLRLQQIACGYLPHDLTVEACANCLGEGCAACLELGYVGQERRTTILTNNPRLDAFMDEIGKLRGQFIAWGKFDNDIDLMGRKLDEVGISYVQYDGRVSEKQRGVNKLAFQRGDRQGFLGKARAGGRGLELAMGHTMLFYSNEWSLELREQAEDRAHSNKQKETLDIIDFIAEGTVDESDVQMLRAKKDVSRAIMNDPKVDWL